MTARILMIDDEPDVLSTLEEHLTDNGYEVISASDGSAFSPDLSPRRSKILRCEVITCVTMRLKL